MTPGDLPCNAPCSWRWCRWWSDGHCMDNDICEHADISDADNETETEDNQ